MKNNIKSWVCLTAVTVASGLTAQAIPSAPTSAIFYSLNGTTWTAAAYDNDLVDGTSPDTSATAGIIHTEITAGGFTLDLIGTHSYPNIGTLASPQMDLGIAGVTGGPAGATIYVAFSANGFHPVPGGSFLTTSAPNNSGADETTSTFVSSGNDGLNSQDLFVSSTTGGTVSGYPVGLIGNADGYAITIVDKFVANGKGVRISDDDSLAVPDGGNTLMLLGSALSVLGLGVFRKSRKA